MTPETLNFLPGARMPNNRLPVLVYRGVAAGSGGFTQLFAGNGWGGGWRNGVFDYDHYHSNAHEVLGVERGSARLQLGGDGGEAVEVAAGDVLVLPAGTGHRRLSCSDDFVIAGAYPPGQEHYDICRERSPEADLRIAHTALPPRDPVLGDGGGVTSLWR